MEKRNRNVKEESKQKPGLQEALISYTRGEAYPFHMPGHKRADLSFPNPWRIDITEIAGFDNLHYAAGLFKDLLVRLATAAGAARRFCLVNGSTCGILAAVSACTTYGGTIIMARNCHKSVYHACILRGLTPVYVQAPTLPFGIAGSVTPASVEKALEEHPEAQAVLLTSPTYDGVVSDIATIAELVHKKGLPLIVDEAHGAHFPYSKIFSTSALACGADVVIQSLHKTLPAFTQTAVLHMGKGAGKTATEQGNAPQQKNMEKLEENLERYLRIYQTSSPSYLLMASVEQCLDLLEQEGEARFSALRENLDAFYEKCEKLEKIRVFRGGKRKESPGDQTLSEKMENPGEMIVFDRDDSKILISAEKLGLNGPELAEILRSRYQLEPEMAAGHYVLALCSLMDEEQGFLRLYEALRELEESISLTGEMEKDFSVTGKKEEGFSLSEEPKTEKAEKVYSERKAVEEFLPPQSMTLTRAMEMQGKNIPLKDAVEEISREFLFVYPPGIPLLAPGELVTEETIERIRELRQRGLVVLQESGSDGQWIEVVKS